MLTTITAEPWEIFSTQQKFEKVTSRVKMRNRKNHRNLKIIFLKSGIVPSSFNFSSIT
jgi:endonuclease V-like protein UPF0215 family